MTAASCLGPSDAMARRCGLPGRLSELTPFVVFAAIASEPKDLKYAAKGLQACRDVVREAVRRNGMALKFASKELRADRDMAELAVSNCGLALKFVAPHFRDVLEIV